MTEPFFVFDLDDTLYLERDYSMSALTFLGRQLDGEFSTSNAADELLSYFQNEGSDVIGEFWKKHNLKPADKAKFIAQMRSHPPTISLFPDTQLFLDKLRERKFQFAIVTDGRSITQRAKIEALGLNDAAAVAISEESGASKPSQDAFAPVIKVLEGQSVVFVGDNPAKDFITPNKFGWGTYMRIDNGRHIHKQYERHDEGAPDAVIQSFAELDFYL